MAGVSGIVSVGQGHVVDTIVVGAATSFLALLADAILIQLLGDPGEEK
jgi:type III secretion system FlhB-like substrate exporter